MKNRFLCTLVATLAIFNAFGSSPETAQPSTTATHATSSHSKIISLAPGITEALCMLGLGNMLVGRTFACDFPTAIQSVPIVMEADGKLDLKAVEKIKPDFIIMPSSLVDSPLHEELSKRRISHIGIKYSSLQDFCQSIFEVATRFDAADAATEWMSELERTINACQDRVQKSLVKARKNNAELKTPSIMIILGRRANGELIVAGRKSYHQSLIELLGMRNASDDNAFLSLKNEESLKESDPDIILEVLGSGNATNGVLKNLTWWSSKSELKAVRTSSIHITDESYPLRAGIRLDSYVKDLAHYFESWCAEISSSKQ